MKLTFSALKVLGLLAFASVSYAQTFTFTAIPDQDETRLQQRFGKVATYLSEQLGVDVKYIPVKSYAAAVTAFSNNQVQLAWFGGLSGVQARNRVVGSEAIAQGYEDPFFQSYIIAHHSTGIKADKQLSEQIKGKRFTFGSKGSTSGRLMPEFFIREAFNEAPDKLFSKVGFSGDHSKTIELVQSGTYEIGAVNYKVWKSELASGKIDPTKVSIIWKTPDYPDYQWSVRGDVDQQFGNGFKDKLQATLIGIKDKALLDAFPRKSFIKANNALYQSIEDTAKAIGLMD